jgi:hypothetical protein
LVFAWLKLLGCDTEALAGTDKVAAQVIRHNKSRRELTVKEAMFKIYPKITNTTRAFGSSFMA